MIDLKWLIQKNMKKLFSASVLIIINTAFLFAQNQGANLDKYWSYRERLTREFIVVGDQQGMSLPASRKDTIQQLQAWGDNTIALGWYLSTLATEYAMLNRPDLFPEYDNNDPNALSRNTNELYYALKALRRLDETAEISFPSPCDSLGLVRNGFFLRDDVPADFHTNFSGINTVKSDYTSSNVYDNEMSQDQVYHILTGLAMIKWFIRPSLVVNGMNIRQEAITHALLIVEWVHEYNWVIKNPSCLVSGVPKDVARGENATLFSYGLNCMVGYISDGNVNYGADVPASAFNVWTSLRDPINPAYLNPDNMHMAMTIMAVGAGCGYSPLDDMVKVVKKNKWAAYPLIYNLLYANDSSSVQFEASRDTLVKWTIDMLNEAPVEGPYNNYPDPVSHGYGTWNRFIRPRTQHYIGDANIAKNKFNGLDYMLLHNLYYLFVPYKWISSVGINEQNNFDAVDVKLYPNPTIDMLTVEMKNISVSNAETVMYNAIGQRVYQSSFTCKQKIDVSTLPQGYYQLMVTDEEGVRVRRGVVVK
jgi:hypothetical protein